MNFKFAHNASSLRLLFYIKAAISVYVILLSLKLMENSPVSRMSVPNTCRINVI